METKQEQTPGSRQLLAKFLQNPQAVLNGVPETGASAGLKEKLYLLYDHLHELLREGKFEEAKILIACNAKVGQAPDSLLVPEKYADLRDAILAVIVSQYSAVMPILRSLGRPGWKIIAELGGHASLGTRQVACKILTGAGEKVVPLLLEAYENNKNPEMIKSMLTIFGELGVKVPAVTTFYKNCLRHPDPAVRRLLIPVVVKAFPKEAEDMLVSLLSDKDQGVLTAVVRGFETTGVTSVQGVQFVLDVVSGYLKPGDELFLQTIRMLRKVDDKPFKGTSLAQSLNEYIGRRGFFSFGSKQPTVSREVELEIIMTIGKVGNFINSDKLERLKGDRDLAMAKAAADALGEINKWK